MKTIKDLGNEKAQIAAQMDKLLDAAQAREVKSFTEDEQQAFDALKRDLDMVERQIVAHNAKQATPMQKADAKQAFTENLREALSGKRVEMKVRELTTTTADPLIPLTIEDIVEPLEQGLIYEKVGIKMGSGLVGQWQFPIVDSAVEATIADEAVEVSDSTIPMSKLNPKTKRISVSIPITIEAINASDSAAYNYAAAQLPLAMKRTLNRALFSTDQVNEEFYGPFAGKTATSLSSTPTYAEILALKGEVLASGVTGGEYGAYVMSEATKALLEATPTEAGGGRTIVEDGKIAGYPVYCTNAIDEAADGTAKGSYIGFGVFAYQPLGQFGDMNIVVDPYSAAASGKVKLTLQSLWATATLRDEAFALGVIATAE